MEKPNKLENRSEDIQAGHGNREMANHEANVESARLFTIFPKEIWMQIFEKIFHPEDLLHLSKSSGLFDMLLRNQRAKTLFPEVIKILATELQPTANSIAYTLDAQEEHFLNCRLVCRTWQIGVDTALQSFSGSSKLLDVASHKSLSQLSSFSDARLSKVKQPVKFLQQFDGEYASKSRNPFIDRSLNIFFGNRFPVTMTDLESFAQQLMQILTIYGHNIWNFSLFLAFHGQPIQPSNIWFYERLRDFLQLMPNLKAFKLRCEAGFSDDEWKALELNLKSCVFPNLKELTYLQLDDVPKPLSDALLRRYSHVKMLSSSTLMMQNSDMLMFTNSMPNLTQIALSLKEVNALIQLDSSIVLWPLKTLIMQINLFDSQLDWQSLFRVLENRWSTTLTELKIDYFYGLFLDNNPTQVLPSLNLPNLKVFAFSSNVFFPLDFILPMRNSLERLVVQYYLPNSPRAQFEPDVENEKEIQFFRFASNLKRSNIWSLFPHLNTAEYSDRVTGKQLCRRPLSIM